MVGTFNFRGAGSSKGRTSWTSKAEQMDYQSMIGFIVYYMHHLTLPHIPTEIPRFTRSDPDLHDLSPIPSQALPPSGTGDARYPSAKISSPTSKTPSIITASEGLHSPNTKPRLLLAGYSYGAMITVSLPPILNSIIFSFQRPLPGSAQAEIRLRADALAEQQNDFICAQISALLSTHSHRRGRSLNADDVLSSPKVRKSSGGVRMGGEEDLRRASHDSYNSRHSFHAPDSIRKSMDRVRSIGKSKRLSPQRQNTQGSFASSNKSGKSKADESQSSLEQDDDILKVPGNAAMKEIPGICDDLQPAYLLISPLQGLVNNLATMWSSHAGKGKDSVSENEMKLAIDPTLALFADDDGFVSVKKLRPWAEKLSNAGKGGETAQFKYTEVAGAGHFWHDYQAIKILQEDVKTFVREL